MKLILPSFAVTFSFIPLWRLKTKLTFNGLVLLCFLEFTEVFVCYSIFINKWTPEEKWTGPAGFCLFCFCLLLYLCLWKSLMTKNCMLPPFILLLLTIYPFSYNFHFILKLNCLTYKIYKMYHFSVAFLAQWSPGICLPDTDITNMAFFLPAACCNGKVSNLKVR